MIDKLITALIIVIMVVTACSAGAQETTETAAAAAPAATTTITTTVPTDTVATTTTVAEATSSHETRNELRQILNRFPPEVGKVLKLDPTLWTNPSYINNYPALAEFVAQHPEVAHNPRFFLEDVWLPSDPLPQTASSRMWNDFFEAIGLVLLFGGIALALMWIIRTVLNHRRWSRLARVQTEVHTKLLDRFSSNEELMAYINTTAGKRFLEAAPIPVQEETRSPIASPINRVLWSVQAGVILGAAGLGLVVVSWSADKEVSSTMAGMGVLGIAVAAGFIVSAIASLMLSRRLGLWSPPPSMTDTAAE